MHDVVESSCLAQDNNSPPLSRLPTPANDGYTIRHPFASNFMPEDREITWTQNQQTLKAKFGWQVCKGFYVEFRERHLAKPRERDSKDGSGFVPGSIIGGERQAKAVAQLDVMFFDLDREDEQAAMECLAKITAAGLAYDAHTTYDHESEVTEVSSEGYLTWAREHGLGEVSGEAAIQFLSSEKKYPASVTAWAMVVELMRQTSEGVKTVFKHKALSKMRVAIVLDRPYVVTEWMQKGFCELDVRGRLWNAVLEKVAREFGLAYDTSCKDIGRAYYSASCKPGHASRAFGKRGSGNCVRLDSVVPQSLEELDAIIPPRKRASSASAKAHSNPKQRATLAPAVEYQGRNLTVWMGRYGSTFDIENVALERELIKEERPAGGWFIECDQEHLHQDSRQRAWCQNATGKASYFTLHCTGSTDDCSNRDRLERLCGYLDRGQIALEDLEDPAYGGGPVPWLKPTKEAIREKIAQLDENSTSDDLVSAVEMIARFGDELFDAEALQSICDKTGKKLKTPLHKKVQVLRRVFAEEDRERAKARTETSVSLGIVRFHDWNKGVPFRETLNAVIRHLEERNATDPKVFRRGANYVGLRANHKIDQLEIFAFNAISMGLAIDAITDWSQSGRECRSCDCPHEIAEKVLVSDMSLPELNGVTDTPFFSCDGGLVTTPGYHAGSQMFYSPPPVLDIADVSLEPTEAEIARAKALLFEDVLVDFPFNDKELNKKFGKGGASKANWLARLIQPFAREMIKGCCPLYVMQKPKERTGASLQADVFSLIAFGHPAKAETEKPDPAEMQKTLITHLKAGSRHIFIDNLHKRLDDPTIATLTTAEIYQGRLLCTNEFVCEPVRCVIEVAGNNLELSDELRGRAVLMRFDAEMENPGERDTSRFRHPNIKEWVKEHRADLVWAVLTIIQAWIAQGKPKWEGQALGGFETYCAVVGGILKAVGINGFLGNRELLRDSVGDTGGVLKSFVQVWWEKFQDDEVKIGSLANDAAATDYQDLIAHHKKLVITLLDLLLVHSDSIDLGFNGWSKTGWQKGLGRVLTSAKDQVFDLTGDVSVRISYRKGKLGMRAQLKRVTLH